MLKRRTKSDGNMKNRIKSRQEHILAAGGAGAFPKRRPRRWSWWCVDATFSPRVTTPKPKAARLLSSPDSIVIPPKAWGQALAAFPMSVRLRHVLYCHGCRVLGDLQGLEYSKLEERRGCGSRTLEELRALVKAVQSSGAPGSADVSRL